MNVKSIVSLAIAFGLFFLSRAMELRGDVIPHTEPGAASERLTYHLQALLLLLGALGSFIYAGLSAFRRSR